MFCPQMFTGASDYIRLRATEAPIPTVQAKAPTRTRATSGPDSGMPAANHPAQAATAAEYPLRVTPTSTLRTTITHRFA